MKKSLIVAALIAALCIGLAACGEPMTTPTPTPTATLTPTPTATLPLITEPVLPTATPTT